MMTISFTDLGCSIRGKTIWKISCHTMLWIVWQERNTRIFEESGEWNRCYGIYFTFVPPYGPLVLPSLEAFHSRLFNLVDF